MSINSVRFARLNIGRRAAGIVAHKIARMIVRLEGVPGWLVALPASLAPFGTLQVWNARIAQMHTRFARCLYADSKMIGARVLVYWRELLVCIEDVQTDKAQFRSFTLAPLRGQGRKFITIGNTSRRS